MSALSLGGASVSSGTLALLPFTPVLIAGGQILFKQASQRLSERGDAFVTVLFDPAMIIGLAIYGIATLLWIQALKNVPLSFAYSFMALSYVAVPILSVIFLGETLNLKYWIGAGLIIAGLMVIQS